MFHNNTIQISNDAIFIADAHFNDNRKELKHLLLKIKNHKINTSQIFLMGDIFDLLTFQITYFVNKNKDIISLINRLSQDIQIVYLEGNHDFNIKVLFPNIKVISRNKQPLICEYKDKKVSLSHGDIFTPFGYNLYTLFIRNKILLNILNIIDINNWLSIKIDDWLKQKRIYNKCDDFNKFAKSRISLYSNDIDVIMEGHFHYGHRYKCYINLPSLACTNEYYRLDIE
ncbi:FIG022708: hypothetical protein [hydrothermal vent metagenome]|uniref:Calcineurin-like phosphoesterase domain-containing protein n=1 Tax=hydrothermal vent metagenome TaxID=652676 RepID=A0A3B1DWJ4_9ZZZZ